MKKVVLLGDSIRLIGYGTRVSAYLGPQYEVWQPHENGGFAKMTYCMLRGWLADMQGAGAIHWNNGIWDVCRRFERDGNFTPIDQYVDNMRMIASHLLEITPNVIFATTTPVQNEHVDVANADILRYNAAVVPALSAMGVSINDLHGAVSQNVPLYIKGAPDNTHLTAEGIEFCAQIVARKVAY